MFGDFLKTIIICLMGFFGGFLIAFFEDILGLGVQASIIIFSMIGVVIWILLGY